MCSNALWHYWTFIQFYKYLPPLIWMLLTSHLWSLWTVELLPHQDPEVAEGEERPEHITCFALQSATDQQRVIQHWIVEDGDYLHVL